MGPYVVDFFCREHRLIVELDGGQHAIPATRDEHRDRWLEKQGYRVLRIWNHEMMTNRDGVLARINDVLCGESHKHH